MGGARGEARDGGGRTPSRALIRRRPALTATLVATLVLACTSTPPPPNTSGAPPSGRASPAMPTGVATPGPTLAEPTAPPTPEPTEPVEQVLARDDFSDGADGWGVGRLPEVRIVARGGTLRMHVDRGHQGFWTTRFLGGEWSEVRADGLIAAGRRRGGEEGLFGFLCGEDNDDFIAALVDTQGGWVVARATGGQVALLQNGEGTPRVGNGAPVPTQLRCVAGDDGSVTVTLSLDGSEVVSYTSPDGPARFSRIGVYAEAATRAFTVSVQEATAYGRIPVGEPAVGATVPR